MPANSFCSFCASAGFQGPHDHFLRETKDPKSAVVCPTLKATRCNVCNVLGHTAKYCGLSKERQQLARNASQRRERQQFAKGAWIESGDQKLVKTNPNLKSPKSVSFAPKYSGKFATLDGDLEDVLLGAGDGRETKSEKEAREKQSASMKQWPALAQHRMKWCAQANTFVFALPVEATELVACRSWANVASAVWAHEENEEALPPVEQIVWGKVGSTKWAE